MTLRQSYVAVNVILLSCLRKFCLLLSQWYSLRDLGLSLESTRDQFCAVLVLPLLVSTTSLYCCDVNVPQYIVIGDVKVYIIIMCHNNCRAASFLQYKLVNVPWIYKICDIDNTRGKRSHDAARLPTHTHCIWKKRTWLFSIYLASVNIYLRLLARIFYKLRLRGKWT